jgi:hypothetical protein
MKTSDEDMLGGTTEEEAMLGTAPPAKPQAKPTSVKKKIEAKAKKKEAAKQKEDSKNLPRLSNPVKSTEPAKAAKKVAKPAKAEKPAEPATSAKSRTVRPPAGPGVNIKPMLTNKQVTVISTLLGSGPFTAESLSEVVIGKDGNKQTFQKTTLGPLIKDGIVTKNEEAKPMTYSLNTKATGKSPEIVTVLKHVPTDPATAITVGFLGGLVWGNSVPNGKRDLWINVRFGRAAGAVLKRLVAIGAVGIKQANDRKPKHYYRNA